MQAEVHIMVQTQSDTGMNWGHGSGKKGKEKMQKRKGTLKGYTERMNKIRG